MDCGFRRNDTGSGVKAQTRGVIPAKAGIPVVFAFEKENGRKR
jgi:hypothetical protein